MFAPFAGKNLLVTIAFIGSAIGGAILEELAVSSTNFWIAAVAAGVYALWLIKWGDSPTSRRLAALPLWQRIRAAWPRAVWLTALNLLVAAAGFWLRGYLGHYAMVQIYQGAVTGFATACVCGFAAANRELLELKARMADRNGGYH